MFDFVDSGGEFVRIVQDNQCRHIARDPGETVISYNSSASPAETLKVKFTLVEPGIMSGKNNRFCFSYFITV